MTSIVFGMSEKLYMISLMSITTVIFIGSLFVNYFGSKAMYKKNIRSISSISDQYFTLITPAKYTFSIWGVIYLLAMIVLGTWWYLIIESNIDTLQMFHNIIILFSVISIVNPLWIMFWVREKILGSLVIMLVIFMLISYASYLADRIDNDYSFWVRMFFSVYIGWISVALSVNIASFLSTISLKSFTRHPVCWSVIVLALISLLTCYITLFQGRIVYPLVILWSLLGIYLQKDKRALQYPNLKICVMVMMWLISSSLVWQIVQQVKSIST